MGTESVEINMERVQARVAKGGHDVPVEDQLRRYPRSFANMVKALHLADEALVYDNSGPGRHVLIAETGSGGVKFYSPVPN